MKASRFMFLIGLISSAVIAGPMGLKMSETLEELQKKATLTPDGAYVYRATSLPGGHPDFDRYTLLVTPEHGLCKVLAFSKPVETSVYGTELLDSFDKYFEALTKKYGEAKRFDYLKSGSIWNKPNEWTTALLKKERTLAAFWSSKNGPTIDDVTSVSLEAHALNREGGIIVIGYEFSNAHECIERIRTSKDAAL
jgi:hypothetical protein